MSLCGPSHATACRSWVTQLACGRPRRSDDCYTSPQRWAAGRPPGRGDSGHIRQGRLGAHQGCVMLTGGPHDSPTSVTGGPHQGRARVTGGYPPIAVTSSSVLTVQGPTPAVHHTRLFSMHRVRATMYMGMLRSASYWLHTDRDPNCKTGLVLRVGSGSALKVGSELGRVRLYQDRGRAMVI